MKVSSFVVSLNSKFCIKSGIEIRSFVVVQDLNLTFHRFGCPNSTYIQLYISYAKDKTRDIGGQLHICKYQCYMKTLIIMYHCIKYTFFFYYIIIDQDRTHW